MNIVEFLIGNCLPYLIFSLEIEEEISAFGVLFIQLKYRIVILLISILVYSFELSLTL